MITIKRLFSILNLSLFVTKTNIINSSIKYNKKFVLLFFILSVSINAQQKVSLALSGGGAKGSVHIGVLKAIEEYGLHVEKVSGSSIGALIGAFYSIGYSVEEIESVMKDFLTIENVFGDYSRRDMTINQKFNRLTPIINVGVENGQLQLPSALASDSRLNYLLMKFFSEASVANKHNFKNFHRELTVVASDIMNEKPEYFQTGNLAKAIRGSISFPLALAPFKYNNTLYSDGGIYNNLPTNVFPDSDLVIAVDVSTLPEKDPNKLNSFTEITLHLINIMSSKSDSLSVDKWDIFIDPDLKNYSATSWEKIDELIQVGYEETVKKLKRYAFKKNKEVIIPVKTNEISFEDYKIGKVDINGLYRLSYDFVTSHLDLEKGKQFSWESVRTGINRLYINKLVKYFWVDFEINSRSELDIYISLEEEVLTRLGIGGYYSDVLGNNLFANVDFIGRLGYNETISISTKIGNTRNGLQIIANVPNFIGLSSFEQYRGTIVHDRFDGAAGSKIEYTHRSHELNTGILFDRNMMIRASAGVIDAELTQNDTTIINDYKNYYFQFSYELDNLDDAFFPTKGHNLELSYKFNYLTDIANGISDINYNLFKYYYLNYGNLFDNSIIFSQEYMLTTVAVDNNDKVPLMEKERVDLTRSTLGFFTPNLYGFHQAYARYTLKLNLIDKLYTYSTFSLHKQWGRIDDIRLKSLTFNSINKGYELGFYYPTIIGPMLLTYSTDDIIPDVFRFSIGYIF